MFLLTVIEIVHKKALLSESIVFQIYFQLEGISKNGSSDFRSFTVIILVNILFSDWLFIYTG